MKSDNPNQSRSSVLRHRQNHLRIRLRGLAFVVVLVGAVGVIAAEPGPQLRSTWPQAYAVARNDVLGILNLRTPYYTIEQNLKKGGAITRIALAHGKAANLLVAPIETRVCDANGVLLSDLNDSAPVVSHRRDGLNEIVTVECELKGQDGRASGLRVKSTLQYRWGYVKIHKEFLGPAGVRVREVCPLATILAPSLSDYGYREGITEEEKAPAFSFGSNRWGKLRLGHPSDRALQTRYVPRSMIFADAGVEGLEWFVGSDLSQWDLQFSGRRGSAQCRAATEPDAAGAGAGDLAVFQCRQDSAFADALRLRLLPGRSRSSRATRSGPGCIPRSTATAATGCRRKRSAAGRRRASRRSIATTTATTTTTASSGATAPILLIPDMDRYDKVLADCRRAGIRTATYFSNKELHPSTKEFQQHGRGVGPQEPQRRPATTTSSAPATSMAPKCAFAPAGSSS